MRNALTMLREVALRRALQGARDRRHAELEEIQERMKGLRRRLRELTDRSLAVGSVHARFFAERPAGEPVIAEPAAPVAPESPATEPSPIPPTAAAPSPPIAPTRRDVDPGKLVGALVSRYPDGFTVGQMKEVLDEVDGRAHTYDAAWALANAYVRERKFELAGTRPGPAGPIRVFRVSPGAAPVLPGAA